MLDNLEAVQIRILYSEGCTSAPPTLELVKNISEDLNLPVNIETVMVSTLEQAQEFNFLGSPTVQIDGVDIEPSARDSAAFGLS
jgi:hypothetical protein